MKQLLIASLFFLSNIVLAQLSVNTNVTDSAMANSIAGNGVSISNVTMNCSNYAYGTFDGTGSNVGIDGGVILTTGFADSPPATACSYTLELSDAGSNGWNCGAVNAYVNGQLVGSYSENSQWGMTSVNIIVETGDNLTLEYVSAGGTGCDESEHSLTLYDPNYMTITTQNAPLTPGNIYTGVADCAGNSLFDSYSAAGPNNENMASYGHGLTYSDPDLTQLVPDATYDVCIMEFDLVPSCSYSLEQGQTP